MRIAMVAISAYVGVFYGCPTSLRAHDLPTDRTCTPPQERSYKPRHSGIGYEVLDAESQVCFVPDDQYKLLDEIVDEVRRNTSGKWSGDREAKLQRARDISRRIADTLTKRGFVLFVDTVTFSDALFARSKEGESERHIYDCDTGSLIYLTVGENLDLPISLVEITISQCEFSHYYVRWQIDENTALDWDTNDQAERSTPMNLPPHQGKSLRREQTLGYYRALRADLWERQGQYMRAIDDYRTAIKLYPDSALARNNFAWLIATVEFDGRRDLVKEALGEAQRAVVLVGTANNLDTLACVYALDGNFPQAIATEKEAINVDQNSSSLQRHLARFVEGLDCTGM